MRRMIYASWLLLIMNLIGCASAPKTNIKASVTYYPIEPKVSETSVTISIERSF